MYATKQGNAGTASYIGIKRFAVHDGPGIRTTLFLKGCTLACRWCHNPEGISATPELAFHEMKCTQCGACTVACPNHRIENGRHIFNRADCTACGKCEAVCPCGALELFGKRIAVSEAEKILLEDRIFYTGGGGITVSGGEPLRQSSFCAELFSRMKRHGIHCAVDTSGNVSWSAFEAVLPDTDLFLYDIKTMDPVKHRCFTGSGNELILENLKKLDACGCAIEIRMLVVPQLNFEEQDWLKAGEFLAGLKHLTGIRLLPYHALARSKYRATGRKDTMPEVPSPSPEELNNTANILHRFGLQAIG